MCFKVRIAIDTYTNVVYEEDVSLSGLKDKKLFWESVDNILKNRQINIVYFIIKFGKNGNREKKLMD